MTPNVRQALLLTLAELGNHYPDMRFGVLVGFACGLSGEQEPASVGAAEDEAVLEAIRRHMRKRSKQAGPEDQGALATLAPTRAALIRSLEQLSSHHADWRFGQLVLHVVRTTGVHLYEVEDDLLLSTTKRLLSNR